MKEGEIICLIELIILFGRNSFEYYDRVSYQKVNNEKHLQP